MPLKKQISKYIFPTLITILTIVVWHKLLWQTPSGEGFYYFDPGQDFFKGFNIGRFFELDTFARIIFDILPFLFKDNLSLYMGFQLFMMVILNLTLYYVINFFTKNKLIALSSTIFFAVSYIGQFEMLGSGNYQRFVQRIPNLIPAFWAFQQLGAYLETNKVWHYFFSIVLFCFSLIMAHFSSFLLPIFIFLPLLFFIEKKGGGYTFKKLWIVIPYIVLNFFLVSRGTHTPYTNQISFAFSYGIVRLFENIIFQLVAITYPSYMLHLIKSAFNPFSNTLLLLVIPILLLYLIGFFLVLKRNRKLITIYLISIIMLPFLLFYNLYLDKVDPLYNIKGFNYYFLPSTFPNSTIFQNAVKGDRYYYLPMIFNSIIWSFILVSLFKKTKKEGENEKTKLVLITFVLVYIYYNTNLIWSNMNLIQFNSILTKNYLNYMKVISSSFGDKTVVVSPRPLLWPAPAVKALFTDKEIYFIDSGRDWRGEVMDKHPSSFYFIDYDNKTWEIIDLSKKYRKEVISNPL